MCVAFFLMLQGEEKMAGLIQKPILYQSVVNGKENAQEGLQGKLQSPTFYNTNHRASRRNMASIECTNKETIAWISRMVELTTRIIETKPLKH